jgi:holliday junction resolvase YEN1
MLPSAFSRLVLTHKSSIYGEIGPGERIALSKLAVEKFEQTGRPLRIAIDVSIWQFQTQASQGGSNPAIRTLYYRLVRFLSTSIQPLFIFDGPHKPPFKRNKRTGQHGATVSNLLTKQLLKLFGFPFYVAPGEAEAECALLEKEGIVDAVLSEDVDTLMFGCGRTLRNWSSESSRGNKSPTHVSVYDAKRTKEGKAGLDREGMILIALMSGGDYITEGIPGCGIKVACEAARAGYGNSLCKISRSDSDGLQAWREKLVHEINTNESKHFRVKHKTLRIPDDFPNREVLGYYTHPVVSSASKIQRLKEEIEWDGEVDIPGLRLFVAEVFDWTYKTGAKKFIRGLAPAVLVHKLRTRYNRRDSEYGDVVLTAMNEMELVRAICGKRTHFSTDGIPELRVIYHPAEIVGLDIDAEEDDSGDYGRDGLAPVNDDDQIEEYVSDDAATRSRSTSPTKRVASIYDPTQPDKAWIPESIAKVGIPLKVEDYEESLRNPRKFIKANAAAKRAATKTNRGMPKGAMDRFLKITKTVDERRGGNEPSSPTKPSPKLLPSSQPALPSVYLAPTLDRPASSQPAPATTSNRTSRPTRSSAGSATDAASIKSVATKPARSRKAIVQKPATNTNPWTIAASSPQFIPNVQKYLSQQPKSSGPLQFKHAVVYINSSPPVPTSSLPPNLGSSSSSNYQRSPVPLSDHESDPEPKLQPGVHLTRGSQASTKEPRTPTKNCKGIDCLLPRKKISPGFTDRRHFTSSSNRSEPLRSEPVARKLDVNMVKSISNAEELDERMSVTENCHSVTNSIIPNLNSMEPVITNLPDHPRAMKDPQQSLSSSCVPPARAQEAEAIILISSPPAPNNFQASEETASLPDCMRKGRKYTVVRESTDGTFWDAVDEEEVRGRGHAYRYSQVEMLDLTGED